MHIVQMVKGHGGRFQQRRASHAVREVALGERFGADKQIVQRTELIDQAAWQRLRLNTHRANHFTATQALLGTRFVLNLKVQANRGVCQHVCEGRQQPGCQTVGVDRQRQQQRRGAGLLVAQPLFFQQLNLTQ